MPYRPLLICSEMMTHRYSRPAVLLCGAMSDDWRLRIELASHEDARTLAHRLGDRDLEHDLERAYGDRVVVSVDGAGVFCYCATRRQAEAAGRAIAQVAERESWTPQVQLTRWHPTAERWEDPDVPLPADESDPEARVERDARVADERTESSQQGYPEYEVRIECGSRAAAVELSRRLDDEDMPHVHRWSVVLVGATDEDAAQALAQRLRGEAPDGAQVTVGLNERAISDLLPHPFAVLGGMGG
jgi:hypothetical protein